ncbi:enoyl-CoA hydratase-related protein [Geobacter sp.]|uniref:enoyl-CoA hydratase-related protein n=1 Tax=Geobacter sp. TaxID=46610 RepID=UPI0026228903|nr:enoyl-CoA hydratase-related protein [Geobacter sp.]
MSEADGTQHILVESREGVLCIRMNRPEKKNALTRAMYRIMADAIAQADADDAVRVILITGTGDCFTSGNDLADFRDASTSDRERERNPFMPAISRAKKPVVAAVSGVAVGIGTTMLLHCDLVYAGTGARFQLPFVNLGLCPELGSSVLLPLLMGHQRAAELLLLGEPFGAESARELGIVNGVCADAELLETAFGKARQLAAQPPASVRLTKALMKRAREVAVMTVMEEEIAHFGERLRSPEAAEAFQAFAERRKPDFSRFK